MNFYSHIEWPKSPIEVSYRDLSMMFGSCFAESMGQKFIENKFRTDLNPFGILYNPESIATAIERILADSPFESDELIFHNGLYHSLSHHGDFSGITQEGCLQKINERLTASAANLQQASRLFVTFGTAYVYRYKETGQVVANCHKLPAKLFSRERLSVAQIVARWQPLLSELFESNSNLSLIFTVSPVRYWQDGVHENQLSKSTLLLAIEQLQLLFPDRIAYFPAYELLLDELRDYRFYADDLFHPSDAAIQFIWERFVETHINDETRQLMKEVDKINKMLNHRPLNPQSDAYRQFISQILLKINQISEKMPYICFEMEQETIYEVSYQGHS